MDLNKLRTSVFEKTGIKIDTDDPIFALVALNESVLSECVDQQVALMRDAADRLSAQTGRLLEAGEFYRKALQQIGDARDAGQTQDIARALADAPSRPQPIDDSARHIGWRWLAAGAAAALLSAALTVGSQWALGQRAAQAQAPQAMAIPLPPALTPEQTLLIQNGEKYAKLWTKLDAKTQARFQALIQQP